MKADRKPQDRATHRAPPKCCAAGSARGSAKWLAVHVDRQEDKNEERKSSRRVTRAQPTSAARRIASRAPRENSLEEQVVHGRFVIHIALFAWPHYEDLSAGGVGSIKAPAGGGEVSVGT